MFDEERANPAMLEAIPFFVQDLAMQAMESCSGPSGRCEGLET